MGQNFDVINIAHVNVSSERSFRDGCVTRGHGKIGPVHAEPETLAATIGARVRQARKAAKMTLVQVAEAADLSQPFLSQAENGRTMLSVLALHRVAAAVGTTAHTLLEDPVVTAPTPTSVVRAGQGRTYELSNNATLRFCVPNDRAMDINEVTAGPHSFAESPTRHDGEEGVHVLEGAIRVVVEDETHLLDRGDTVYYSASRSHQWFNDSDERARFLFVTSPPGL